MLTKLIFSVGPLLNCLSQCSRSLKRSSEVALLLKLKVRITPVGCLSVVGVCVFSGRGPWDELIARPEESYRPWCVVVCDLESS
jgi:hypothetical protein